MNLVIMFTSHDSINSRQLTAFSSQVNELAYDPNKNYLFDLSYLAGIYVEGDRAQEFLQGQLSCDLREVNDQQIRQGALCNLKGRILALMDVINWPGHGIHLILPADMRLETQASLAKPALFSRVTLHQAANYQLFGFYLQNRDDIIPFDLDLTNTPLSLLSHESYCCYCLANNFYILLVDTKHAQTMRDQFINQLQLRGSLAWHALQLQHKHLEIYPESRGMFLPHRLGLQLTGHISFNKGCYKGQEIIARTHYRAKLKHELRLFTIQIDEIIKTGQKLFNDNDNQEIGEIIDYCPIGERKILIAASIMVDIPPTVRIESHMATLNFIDLA